MRSLYSNSQRYSTILITPLKYISTYPQRTKYGISSNRPLNLRYINLCFDIQLCILEPPCDISFFLHNDLFPVIDLTFMAKVVETEEVDKSKKEEH